MLTETQLPTIVVAVLGGLGLLWLLGKEVPKLVDTKKTRTDTLNALSDNPGIPGGPQLLDYLTRDGFIEFTFVNPNVGNNSPLVIGLGSGKTVWPHTLDTLQRFNDPGGGIELHKAVQKAISGTPQGDDPESRAQVVAWLETFAAADDPGFSDLVNDLAAGGWATGRYTPPTPPPSALWKTLAIGDERTTIVDYPKWLMDLTTVELLDRVDKLAYPTDPTAKARELVWLQVQQVINTVGFDAFSSALDSAGWNTHPPGRDIPEKGKIVIPQLGGLTNVDVHDAFSDWTAAGIERVVQQALNTNDPGFGDRNKAFANLKTVQQDKWARYYTNFDVLTTALDTIGFAASPRGTTAAVPGGSAKDFYVTGITESRPVRSDQPNQGWSTLQEFCATCTADDIEAIAATGDSNQTGEAFVNWICAQTFLRNDLWVAGQVPGLIGDARAATADLVKYGILMSPPERAAGASASSWVVKFETDSVVVPVPGPGPIPGNLMIRAAYLAYFAANTAAPKIYELEGVLVQKGEPVVGVPGCLVTDVYKYAAQ